MGQQRKWRVIFRGPWGRRQQTVYAGNATMALVQARQRPGETVKAVEVPCRAQA